LDLKKQLRRNKISQVPVAIGQLNAMLKQSAIKYKIPHVAPHEIAKIKNRTMMAARQPAIY
jgi:hypothetical protein